MNRTLLVWINTEPTLGALSVALPAVPVRHRAVPTRPARAPHTRDAEARARALGAWAMGASGRRHRGDAVARPRHGRHERSPRRAAGCVPRKAGWHTAPLNATRYPDRPCRLPGTLHSTSDGVPGLCELSLARAGRGHGAASSDGAAAARASRRRRSRLIPPPRLAALVVLKMMACSPVQVLQQREKKGRRRRTRMGPKKRALRVWELWGGGGGGGG